MSAADEGALTALVRRRDDGAVELASPAPGVLRWPPRRGAHVVAGEVFASLEVLGQRRALLAPAGADGIVTEVPGAAPRAVGAGDAIAVLGQLGALASAGAAGGAGAAASGGRGAASASGGLVLRASSSGRFYRRPGLDKPPLVEDGATITTGQSIGLLEVMKTFSRVHYGGEGLPATAKVVRVVPADGADVEAGDVLLELEAV